MGKLRFVLFTSVNCWDKVTPRSNLQRNVVDSSLQRCTQEAEREQEMERGIKPPRPASKTHAFQGGFTS